MEEDKELRLISYTSYGVKQFTDKSPVLLVGIEEVGSPDSVTDMGFAAGLIIGSAF